MVETSRLVKEFEPFPLFQLLFGNYFEPFTPSMLCEKALRNLREFRRWRPKHKTALRRICTKVPQKNHKNNISLA